MAKKTKVQNRKTEPPPDPAKMGRKPIEITKTELENLAGLQCTRLEFAFFFGCSVDTIERRVKEFYDLTFADFFDHYRNSGLISVRRAQLKLGVEMMDSPMLRHLGKHLLGQHEQFSGDLKVKHSGEIQTGNKTMDDVKRIVTDPVASKLSLALGERLLKLEQEELSHEQVSKKGSKS